MCRRCTTMPAPDHTYYEAKKWGGGAWPPGPPLTRTPLNSDVDDALIKLSHIQCILKAISRKRVIESGESYKRSVWENMQEETCMHGHV